MNSHNFAFLTKASFLGVTENQSACAYLPASPMMAPAYDHAELTSNAAAFFVWTYLCGQIARRQK